MDVRKVGRRHFLIGAGGAALAIPFLGSLVPKLAKAATARPRFVCFGSTQGAVWHPNMFPSEATLTNSHEMFSGHFMRWGALQAARQGADSVLSPVLQAPADVLTDDIVSKMMVVSGLDIPIRLVHHSGGYLGNWAASLEFAEGNFQARWPSLRHVPTIDQVMAWSPSFYPDINQVSARSLQIGWEGSDMCWGYQNPGARSGPVYEIPHTVVARDIFNQLFPNGPPTPGGEPGHMRTPIVDRVLEHYQHLNNGTFGEARQLSQADRMRLEAHMDRLFELERRLNAANDSCNGVEEPPDNGGNIERAALGYPRSSDGTIGQTLHLARRYYEIHHDVVAAAFACGVSRIAVIASHNPWHETPNPMEWHTTVHSCNTSQVAQDQVRDSNREFFKGVFLDLVTKLESVEDSDGSTVLDNSLVMWSQEAGNTPHDHDSTPVVTAGGACGYFNTGRYYDYRNMSSTARIYADKRAGVPVYEQKRPGVLYQQWLATVLQSMGLSPAEFEIDGQPGYGQYFYEFPDAYPDRLRATASTVLPQMRR